MLGFAEHPWCHPAALRAAGMTALRETCARARAPAFARLRLAARRPTPSASYLAGPSRSLIARARAPAFARLRLAARRPTPSASYLAGPSRSLIARARAPAFARLRLAARR